jgi:hypothetical protein
MLRLAVLVLSLLLAAPVWARQAILFSPIKFGDGEFTFTHAGDGEVALSYKGTEIYRSSLVQLQQIVKVDDTNVALFSSFGKNNKCAVEQLIVSLSEKAPDPKLEIYAECHVPDPLISRHRIVFMPSGVAPGRPTPLMIWTPRKGLTRVGEVRFLPQENTNWANFDPAKAANTHDLFDNKDVHDAAASLLGENLYEVVFGLSVSRGLEIIDGKFVAVFSCQVHACGGANRFGYVEAYAFFGIDVEKRHVFAASGVRGQLERFWPADFTAWPQELRQAYDRSKSE